MFAGATILTVVILTLFAISLAQSQSRQRRDVEKRFHDRATVSAALTDALFSLSSTQTQAQASVRFGGATINPTALAATRRQANSLYLAIVNESGRTLAATPGAPMRVGLTPHVKAALKSGRIQLSNLVPGPAGSKIVESAVPFTARVGRRVELSGIATRLLAQFLGGFLKKVPNVADADSYVVDGNNVVIASTTGSAKPGDSLPDEDLANALKDNDQGDYDSGRYFTSSPIAGSPWRIVLSASSDDLYSSINGGRRAIPWIIFAAFAVAALIGLFLLRRVLLASRQLERAELSRSHALEINDNIVQRLVMAKYALDQGSTEMSQEKLSETLHEAQQLVTSLLEQKEIGPGVLRRGEAADTEVAPEPKSPAGDES